MVRGLSNAPEKKQSADWIPSLILRDDGESSRIRFLTDEDEFYLEYQHWVDRKDIKGFYPCLQAALEQPCDLCDSDDERTRKARNFFFAWVYEFYHDYTDKGKDRRPVKEGKITLYREDINDVKLLRMPSGHKESIQMRANKFGTLLDREFDWTRSGEKGDTSTQYILDPSDEGKKPMPKELAALAAKLPDLEDVAMGRVTSLNPQEKKQDKAPWVEDDENDKAKKKVESTSTELPF
jgi:hypothetical protein